MMIRQRSSESTTRRHRPDYGLVMLSLALLVIGLIVVYAISPALGERYDAGDYFFVGRQLIAIGLGVVAFLIVAAVPLERWRQLKQPLAIAAVIATLITLVMPVSPDYPAHRWIRIGGFSLQSVEVVKFALVIWLAAFLSQRAKKGQIGSVRMTLKPLLIALGGLSLVVGLLQRDLGSAGVIAAMMAVMAFVAGLPFRRIAQIVGLVVIGVALLIIPFSYRQDRVATFLNPESDCQGAGYQACQALIAIGSGGLFGKGLAHSGQAYGYLPEAANDSIFAIVAEKFGFVGATLLVVLFVAFFVRLKNVMERAPDEFSRLVVAGVLAWLSTQAFINIGAMIGLFPLKGITLPFISYGGTSVVFVMAAVGLVFNISRYTSYNVRREGDNHDNSPIRRGNRRPYYSAPGRR